MDQLTELLERLDRSINALRDSVDSQRREGHSPRDVGRLLGLPYETVLDELIHTGRLGHVRVGRRYVIPDAELQRFLTEEMQAPRLHSVSGGRAAG